MKTGINLVMTIVLLTAACAPKQPSSEKAADVVAPVTDSMTKKIITAQLFVKSEKVSDFLAAARPLIDSSNTEPGCESYTLYQNPYDKTRFIFVEIWKDQVAIDNHFSKPYFKAFGPKTGNWLMQPTEVKIFDVVLNE